MYVQFKSEADDEEDLQLLRLYQEATDYILKDFKGYLQSDGYTAYEKIGKRKGVTHLCCLVHARREFEKVLDYDKVRAEVALGYIQKIYKIQA